jgi:hypothetical protein
MSPVPEMQTVPLISYQEFLSILLTTAAVGLGLVAIELAVLGFWGYRGLRRVAEKRVAESMHKVLRRLPETQQVVNMYESMRHLHDEMKRLHAESMTWVPPAQADEGEPAPDPFRPQPDIVGQGNVAGGNENAPISSEYPGEEGADDDERADRS